MKTKLDIYNHQGEVVSQIEQPEWCVADVNHELIALAVRVHLANQRQGTSKVKTRGEVNRTTKKVWKQKGTGRARHGSRGAPIFVGGGVAHGPSGDQSYKLKLPKKMRRQALVAALSQTIVSKKLIVIDELTKVDPTTKSVAQFLKKMKLDQQSVLCLLDQPLRPFIAAARNLPQMTTSQAKRTNVYEIVSADTIIIHQPALEQLASIFKGN